ncbi:hypothetical protein [Paraglaciecola arctica]|uniref:Uncharacterized protein n=1 Tax=Paraglaciecola arctica BSs20135 TaxID=493475 RepID=K6Z4A2_9ALTE|nr:hypothetical protein [Paraglaciecola arctica]GAC18260.1 hypothetical protein GARC_1280 [Paraglaciecola arctica BSs20135]
MVIEINQVKHLMKNTFITACIVGLIASIAFILVQPLFGLATLTSRHAAAYVNLGGYSEIAALFLSWFVHISVSIFYALLATVIFNFNHSVVVSVAQTIILGWFTTLIATPANEWVVKLVTTQQFPDLGSLAALNTQVGPKLWLHILFFAFVLGGFGLQK